MKFIIFLTLVLLLLPVAFAFTASGGGFVVDKMSTGDATGTAAGGSYATTSTSTDPEPTATATGGGYAATTTYFTPTTATEEEEDAPVPSGGNGGGGRGSAVTAKLENGPIETTLSTLGTLNFIYKNERHKIRISELGAASVSFRIESEPIFVRVNVGEDKEVNIDGDDKADIILGVISTSQTTARIRLSTVDDTTETPTEVAEVIEKKEEVVEKPTPNPSSATGGVVKEVTGIKVVDEVSDAYEINLFWVGIFVVLAVMIIVLWVFWKKRS